VAPDLTSHAGRWVALVGNLVAGVGDTPDEALAIAGRRHPEQPAELSFVELPEGSELRLSPIMDVLAPFLQRLSLPVYLVGGAIRDALLERPPHNDLDFVVPDQAIKVAFRVADMLNAPAYALDPERDVGRVVLPAERTILDFAKFRGQDLEADLWDRDFTINSMALPAAAKYAGSVIDPCGGQVDLKAGLVRQTNENAIANDPVRALRALRMSLGLEFTLTAETANAVSQAGTLLERVSQERLRDELLKLLETGPLSDALSQMAGFKLLPALLPEVALLEDLAQPPPHHESALAHTISVLRWLREILDRVSGVSMASNPSLASLDTLLSARAAQLASHLDRDCGSGLDGRMLLILGALFHDIGKVNTRSLDEKGRIHFFGHELEGATLVEKRMRHLCFSRKATAHVASIVAGHMRPLHLSMNPPLAAGATFQVSRRAIYRFFRDTGEAGIDIILLSLADHLATYAGPGEMSVWSRMLALAEELFRHYYDRQQDTISPPLLLNGHELMDLLGLEPGPEIGRLLAQLAESQAAGEVTSREQAIRFVRRTHEASSCSLEKTGYT